MSHRSIDLRGISDFLIEGPEVDFRTFVTHQDYLNLMGVYDFWLSKSKDITTDISAVALTGSLAGGKCRCGHERVVTANGYRRFDALGEGLPYGFTPFNIVVEQPDGTFCWTSHFYKEASTTVLHLHGASGRAYTGTPAHPILACRQDSSVVELVPCGELKVGDSIVRVQQYYSLSSAISEQSIESFVFYGICMGCGAWGDVIQLDVDAHVGVWCVSALVEHGITPVVGFDPESGSSFIGFRAADAFSQEAISDTIQEDVFFSRDTALSFFVGYLLGQGVSVHEDGSFQLIIPVQHALGLSDVLDYLGAVYSLRDIDADTMQLLLPEEYVLGWLHSLRDVCTRVHAEALVDRFALSNVECSYPAPAFPKGPIPVDIEHTMGFHFDRIVNITTSVEDVYDITVPATHLFMSGGVINHNTTMANLLTCYYLYRVFRHGDIYKYYGILRGDPIYFLYFSVSLKQAERSGFKQLRSFLRNAPWFKKHAPVDPGIESSIRFTNGLSVEFASGESHAIGLNVVGAILDEANFRKGVGQGLISEYTEVQMLAQQLEDRMYGRFLRGGGHLLSLMIYVSSASYASSFMEDKLQELKRNKHALVYTAVQYKICPQNYSKKKFEVFCGYDQLSPCIVTSPEHKASLLHTLGLPAAEAAGLFEKVPEDLRVQFQKNIWLAIQNHCGRSTALRGSFITNYDLVRSAYSDELKAQSPLRVESVVVSDQDDVPLSTVFDPSRFVHTDRPHVLAADLSLSGDHASLSCVRYDGVDDEGRHHHSHVFTLDLVPPPFPGTLKISKVEDLILWLAEHLNIIMLSTDNYQSAQMRQRVSEALSLPDVRFSIDATDIPHLTWLSMLVDRRFDMQYYERLDQEIREAVHDNKKHKVVKREGSSDDQFQTLVSAAALSDYFSVKEGSLSDLEDARLNLSSARSIERLLGSLGYQQLTFDKHHRVSGGVAISAADGVQQEEVVDDHLTMQDIQSMMDKAHARERRRFAWLDNL